MLKIYIAGVDRSSYLDDASLVITDQIQQKADTLGFSLRPGVTAPSENQDVKVWDVVEIVSLSSVTLTVKDVLSSGLSILDYGKIRAGDQLFLGISLSTQERVDVLSVAAGAAGQVVVTLVAAATSSHAAGQMAGKLRFGGVLSSVKALNPRQLTDVEYQCLGVDYTKIFDKRNANDTWADADARYIINSFVDAVVNYNLAIDEMEYADNAAVQAEWIESGDGANPTLNVADQVQGSSCVNFPWTHSGTTATFSATPSSQDLSDFVGAASGAPVKGNLTLWQRQTVAGAATLVKLRIGSDSSNYAEVSFTPGGITMAFMSVRMLGATVVGTPVWTAVDYCAVVVTEGATGALVVDDLRMTADGSFTLYGVEATKTFDDARAAFKKPTVLMQDLADALQYAWYVDYERDIKFFRREAFTAPFEVGDDQDNFDKLEVSVDASQIKNRQVVRGGTYHSSGTYSQAVLGDDAVREWVMKADFADMTVKLDDNTSTDSMEATTTTTTVKATAHGLATGDYIVNRSRSNAVRVIAVVDADHFTVEAVTGQVSGDTFSKFATSKTVGVENLDAEASYDYMTSFASRSVRASTQTGTLKAAQFLLFTYVQVIPVRIQVTDFVSVAAMKALIGGDGIFEGQLITDESIESLQAARDRASAEIAQFANPVVTVTFTTDQEGLKSGQTIHVTDSAKGIDDDYLIQRVRASYRAGDLPAHEVTCASSLFGLVEFFQRLIRRSSSLKVSEDETIDTIVTASESITMTDVVVTSTSHNPQTEAMTLTDASFVQPVNYATIFVAGHWTPTISVNGADHKRQFILNGSPLG